MGHLEITLMETLWIEGEGSVHDVLTRLARPLAYNTVMTTLDRLYKKGLLNRRKQNRAYFYRTRLSRVEWEQKQAGHFLAQVLSRPGASSGLLASYLVDAVEQHDAALLEELETRIRARRAELDSEG